MKISQSRHPLINTKKYYRTESAQIEVGISQGASEDQKSNKYFQCFGLLKEWINASLDIYKVSNNYCNRGNVC
jgi:hypothetical protein